MEEKKYQLVSKRECVGFYFKILSLVENIVIIIQIQNALLINGREHILQ